MDNSVFSLFTYTPFLRICWWPQHRAEQSFGLAHYSCYRVPFLRFRDMNPHRDRCNPEYITHGVKGKTFGRNVSDLSP